MLAFQAQLTGDFIGSQQMVELYQAIQILRGSLTKGVSTKDQVTRAKGVVAQVHQELPTGSTVLHQSLRHVRFQGVGKGIGPGGEELIAHL
jgi:hypothetical protein